MRILFYTAKLDIGGCPVNAINLARALVGMGHEVFFFAQAGVLLKRLVDLGIKLHPINYDVRHPSITIVKELAKCVKNYQIDIVQAFDRVPLLEAYGSEFLHRKPVFGIITSQREPEFSLPKYRMIGMVNPDMQIYYTDVLHWPLDRTYLITERLDCEYYRPNKIRNDHLSSKYHLDPIKPTVTLISRISTDKWQTINLFIQTVKLWQEKNTQSLPVQFTIVGDGSLMELALGTARISGVSENLNFLGEIVDIPEIINLSTIVIGMASTCQQALACAKPVIVIGNEGYSEVITPDTFDYLAHHHFNVHKNHQEDPEQRLMKLVEEILQNPTYQNKLEEFGRKIAVEKFDSSIGAKKLLCVYNKLLAEDITLAKRAEQITLWIISFLEYVRSLIVNKLGSKKNTKLFHHNY